MQAQVKVKEEGSLERSARHSNHSTATTAEGSLSCSRPLEGRTSLAQGREREEDRMAEHGWMGESQGGETLRTDIPNGEHSPWEVMAIASADVS